ncbi:MAG: hypothetical protein ACREBC_29975, partial [Pyrinomonadaceae bacterium]
MKFLPLLLSLIAIVYLSGEVYAQRIPSFQFGGNPSQQVKRADQKAPVSEEELLKAIYKEEAVQVLRDALNSSSLIEDIGQRSL